VTAVALLALGLTLSPQSAPPAAPQTAPAAVIPAPPLQPAAARAAVRHRRDEIGVMEGVLAAAVRLGAAQIAREMQAAGPGPSGLIGQPRARGFILEGYGIFFNVDIPTLQTSVMWSMQQLQRDQQVTGQSLDALRSLIETLPDADAKRQYQAALKRLEQQVGPIPRGADAAASNVAVEPDEPDARYTKAVISSCLDAMLEHSKPMGLGPDEWLTVALTGSDTTLASNQLYEASTVVLRVKGSDLADYFAGRLTRDEVRARVEVREF
jgi:hypothetical protein